MPHRDNPCCRRTRRGTRDAHRRRAEPGRSGGEAERLADAVALALRARGIEASRPPPPSSAPAPDVDALRDARLAYGNLHPDETRRTLAALLARLDANGGAGLSRADLLDALLLDAMAAQALGDDAAADGALDRALVVEPDLALDPAQYPPTLRQRLATRRAARSDPTTMATIVVRDAPPSATVYIDGEALPASKRSATVTPGPHLLRVEAPGFEPHARRLDVAAPTTVVPVTLAVDAGARLHGRTDPGRSPDASLRAAARALGGSLLLVDLVSAPTGTRVVLDDVSAGRRVQIAASPSDVRHPAFLAARLARALSTSPTRSTVGGIPARVWWVSAGAAAVAIAAVALIVATTASPAPATQWTGRGDVAR